MLRMRDGSDLKGILMKIFWILLALLGLLSSAASAQSTRATCRCNVECSFADGSTFASSTSWDRRPNNRRYGRIIGTDQINDCRSQCDSYSTSLNAGGIAAEREACGPWSCTSVWSLGRNKTGDAEPRSGTYTALGICEPEIEKAGNLYQYATKAVCGVSRPIAVLGAGIVIDRAAPGLYSTAVNVHNPNYHTTKYRWKVVSAGRESTAPRNFVEGQKAEFAFGQMGPDHALVIDCPIIDPAMGALFDGFVVIESDDPLDVSAVHTTGLIDVSQPATQLRSIPDVEITYTPERRVNSEEGWYCHNITRQKLDDPSLWYLDDGAPAVMQSGTSNVMSYTSTAGANGEIPAGDYSFDFPFCLCDGGSAAATVSSLRTDDGVAVDMTGTPVFASSASNFGAAGHSFSATAGAAGNNALSLLVNQVDFSNVGNVGNLLRAQIEGLITIQNGYLGQCQ